MLRKNPLNLKNKRIFVGFNYAGAAGIYSYTRVLKRRGYQIDFYGVNRINFNMPVDVLLQFSSNLTISFFQRLKYFFKILPKYDIWHFNYATTLFFYPLNLFILRLFGKKIVCTFRGSDIRNNLDCSPSKNIIRDSRYHWPELYYELANRSWWAKFQKDIRMRVFCWLSDRIVLTGPFLASSVKKYDKIIPYARDIDRISLLKKLTIHKKLIILHAPSRSETKGTAEVARVFNILSKAYPQHEFKILTNLPHQDLIYAMSQAHIIIDQLVVGWYGGQAVEAMALGKTVMCNIQPFYLNLMPFKNLPIFNTNIWNLKEDLVHLINSPKLCQKFSLDGYRFVKKYHSANVIADEYLEIYQN